MSGFVMALVQLWVEIPAMVGYIRGQAFRRPLSQAEEADCLKRLAEGDESARDELIERNMRLVAHVVKKFHPKHEQLDDYISIGTIGLMKAVNSFTLDRKTKLATYAARCIENEIVMSIGCVSPQNKQSTNNPLSTVTTLEVQTTTLGEAPRKEHGRTDS